MNYFLLIASLLFSTFSFAAPKAELWDYWNQSDPQNQQTISHQNWQQFLDQYVIERGTNTLVSYANVSSADQKNLQNYISTMAQLDPRTYNKAQQYAYWVNLYNAITVNLILENYPTSSITKLGGLFSFGPWENEVVTIAGKDLTLNDIEHRILRPIWQDARTHYAVNCASLGCPNLQNTAFSADNTEMLLEKAAKEFINSDKGVLVGNNANNVTLSSIYEWFLVDFSGKEGLEQHLKHYRSDLSVNLNDVKYEYDWSLNQAN
ncbi:DUF547 domain-containing protein [Vibrio sp. MA40-2]|uniref:DUF547 domain-containing protein n=1 Tax=Vibrio sp. MA40-2 TaxID=3391828 RepID=UPI0039A6E28A